MKLLLLCAGFLSLSFMATAQATGCTTAPNGQYPDGIFTPSCNGNAELIVDYAFTGEYSVVKVTEGIEYEFMADSVEGTPAFVTIASQDGSVLASGTSKVTWTPADDMVVNFYTHLSQNCSYNDYEFTARRVKCRQGERDSYCEPTLNCSDGAVIEQVKFADLNNVSACSTNGFSDYTAKIANVEKGRTYSLGVKIGYGWFEQSVSVWIDYNKNFLFDTDEFVYIGTVDQGILSKNITIPSNIADGDYRMRVRLATVGQGAASAGNSCNVADGYGETEDYTLRVGTALGTSETTKPVLTVSPNPTNGFVTVNSSEAIASISVISTSGQTLRSIAGSSGIDLKGLSAGIYLLQITHKDGTTVTRKIIKK